MAGTSVGTEAAATDPRRFRAAVALAAVPFVAAAAATVLLVGSDYFPSSDLAATELKIREVGHHPVLVGLWSRSTWSHPGPMQFYLAAPFYWLTGGASIGLVLAALAVNLASVVGVLFIARRRGGNPLVYASLLALLLLCRSLGPETLGDSWNVVIGVLPFALLAFVVWSMLAGELWALPAAAVVATFLVQTHISFLSTAGPLVAVGLAGMVLAARERPDRFPRRRVVRTTAATLAALVILWLPPVIDVLVHDPSNLGRIITYFRRGTEEPHDVGEAWRVVSGQFAYDGEWLTGKRTPILGTGESPYLYAAPLPWLLVVLIGSGVLLWRRSREGRFAVATVAVMGAATLVSVMRTLGPVFDYRLRYSWVPPAIASVLVLWAAGTAVVDRWPSVRRGVAATAVTATLVATGTNTISAIRAGIPHEDENEVIATLVAGLPIADYHADPRPVVVCDVIGTFGSPYYARGVLLQLERRGIDARVPPGQAMFYSDDRIHRGGPVADRLLVATGPWVAELLDDPDFTLVSRWSMLPPDAQARVDQATRDGRPLDLEASLRALAELEIEPKVTGTDTVAVFRDGRPGVDAARCAGGFDS